MTEKIIDSHQHFWDPYQFDYFWLEPDDKILYREYLPEHLKPELDKAGVERSVFVQANHQLAENNWVLDLIDRTPWQQHRAGAVSRTRPGSCRRPMREQTSGSSDWMPSSSCSAILRSTWFTARWGS